MAVVARCHAGALGHLLGAGMLGASDPTSLPLRRFDVWHPAARQVARTAAVLPGGRYAAVASTARFCGIRTRADVSLCSPRAYRRHGRRARRRLRQACLDLPLTEQLRRLLAGCTEPIAAFSPDGALIHATPAALIRLDGADTNAAATEALARQAAACGVEAEASLDLVPVGSEGAVSLIATFGPLPSVSDQESAMRVGDRADETDVVNMAPAVPPAEEIASADLSANDAAKTPRAASAASERRRPLRFVWQMDADGCFTLTSDDFLTLIGSRTAAAALGRPWDAKSRQTARARSARSIRARGRDTSTPGAA